VVDAQGGDNRAGLVIQFSDGSVQTACLDLGPDGEATGEELLRAAGYSVIIDYSSGFGGGTVCKIGGDGCSFPAEACFCQCTMKPGDPCVYWIYFFQQDGQWRYSNVGASSFVIKPGDVQGWVWGSGSVQAGVQPPLISLDQVCGAAIAPPTPEPVLPTATEAPLPTSTTTALPSIPKSTPTHTTTPSATPSPTGLTPTQEATGVPSPTGSPQASPSTTTTPAPSATAEASPTSTLVPSATATFTPQPNPSDTAIPPATLTRIPDTLPVPTEPSVEQTGGTATNYVVFGLLVVTLLGVLIFLRLR
jgi:hypothetical protein